MDWATLPDHIIVSILANLPLRDRCKAGRVCKAWWSCFRSPYLWKHFQFEFLTTENERCIKCVDLYGQTLQNVCIILDQSDVENRQNACKVLDKLSGIGCLRLKCLKLKFTGENPLFYAGLEFVSSLKNIFACTWTQGNSYQGLKEVDLSGLCAALDDNLINVLARNHPNLEKLNIRNKMLVCKVTSNCIRSLVERCHKLKDLQLFQSSICEDVMTSFIENDECCLEHLSLFCRRDEKYGITLTNDIWEKMRTKLPHLRVTLWFDHTCPLHKIPQIMQPAVPCKVLRLETFSRIYDEINLGTSYYEDTLEKMVVSTTASAELNNALLNLSARCSLLNALHVFCLLDKATVDKILDEHPVMKKKGWYTLKHIMEPHPWNSGGNC